MWQKFAGKFLSDRSIREVFLGSGLTIIFKLLGAVLSFAVTLTISRLVNVNDVGIYFLAFSMLMFSSNFARLGIDNSLLRYIGIANEKGQNQQVKKYLFNVLLWLVVSSVTLGTIFYLTADFIANDIFAKPALAEVIKVLSVAILPIALYNAITTTFQAISRFTLAAFFSAVSVPLVMLIAVLITASSMPISAITLMICYGLSCAITLIACLLLLRRYAFRDNVAQDENTIDLQDFWRASFVMFGVLILDYIALNIPQILVGYYWEASAVALFAVAIRITNLIGFLLTSVSRVMAPKLAHYFHENNQAMIIRLLQLMLGSAGLVGLVICLSLMMFSDVVLGIFGEQYRTASTTLSILAFTQLILLINGIGKMLLQMTQHESSARLISLFYTAILLGAALILTPQSGIDGTALALLIAALVSTILTIVSVRKNLTINLIWPRHSSKEHHA